ncbi:SspB-related isopeptide-forming adhesin [Streptococcus cuniculipharyngis]|uniref:LPXTG cell wall anchor domain-containing protein n=1 Tax=Streptococcus cuniculipharyngis TaxID=1562651 RepID=A0A5C5SEX1_9STRE|nr:SspB-related isopeptide-forming adhesin [Streptococcus cuniculipharyngis]TWS98850.1 LPXTG cell wall anchor domain-containing protein [Streptococcus cuniculipharyngis]
MTLPIQVKPIITQEKGEKHVFRKSKKYRTLCSVALGTVATAVIALGGGVAQADELATTPVETSIVLTDNPATNLPEAQPIETVEHNTSLSETGKSQGTMPVTIDETPLKQAINDAKAEGVTITPGQDMDLGTTQTAEETSQGLDTAKADMDKQVSELKDVTAKYQSDKADHAAEVARIEGENETLKTSHKQAEDVAKNLEKDVNASVSDLTKRFSNVKVRVTDKTITSGDGTSPEAYESYTKLVKGVSEQNQAAIDTYVTKKTEADAQTAKNKQIEAENVAGLAKAKEDNEAITKRNQAGQAAIDEENRRGQAAVDQANKDKQAQVSNRQAEIEAIKKRNAQKQAEADATNKANEAYNASEKARYDRELAEIQKGEEGYISEALAQALDLNRGEPQAQHGAATRNPDHIISTGDAMLGGYSRILDSTGFFVYDQFRTGETLRFNYSNLQNASFAGKKITGVTYDITNLVSPAGTNSVTLVVPNDPTEGFIAYRGDGTGDWRNDKMEFRVDAKYTLADGSQVTFSKEQPGVFTHSSLNHNNIGLEYVKDSSGKFVPINGSTVQVTDEGLARSLGSNRAHEIGTPEEWDTTSSRYAYKGAIVSTVTSGNTYRVTFGQGDMPTQVGGKTYWFALNTLPVARTVRPYTPKPLVKPNLDPVPEPLTYTPSVYKPKTFTPEPLVTFTPKPTTPVEEPNLALVKVALPTQPVFEKMPTPPTVPNVQVHGYRLATKPGIHKDVENSDRVSIDKSLVAKASPVNYPLEVGNLSPNRITTTSLIFEDYLPAGYVLNETTTKEQNTAYDLAYDRSKHLVRLTAKDSLLSEVNKDLAKSYRLIAPVLYGTVVNDGATYTNTYKLIINQGTPTAYTVTSNPVTVRTPGDGTTTTLITPNKTNKNSDGVVINGQAMLVGSKNFYTLSWDLDQYKGIVATQDAIAKGFYVVDDYPEEALEIDTKAIQILTPDGQTVRDILVETYQNLEEVPTSLKEALLAKKISPKGAFQVFRPKDNEAFYETYVKTGQSLTIIDPMTVKDSLYNSGQTYTNKAYQVDFGLAYETEDVSNFIPIVTPKKSNTTDKGVTIDGKTVLPDTVNYYKIVMDYSAYKGMSATKDQIAKGFFMVDDYPEEALELNPEGIQVIDGQGQAVKGLSVKVYASLSEAPKTVQDAMAGRGFVPKGAIQVFTADDPQTFYDTYVKTGQTLVVTNPMTIKKDLVKTGGDYANTAYQIDFGLAYVTETIVNNAPKLDPKKDVVIDLSHKDQSLDGKEIPLNQVFTYRLQGAHIPANRATALTAYSFSDDYDETHDQYDGVYQAYLMTDVTLADGTVLKSGTEVTKYTLQTVDTTSGQVSISFDRAFLTSISDDSTFQADIYLQMKRIAAGEVENTFSHMVNGVTITSNTVKTTTPEPVIPPTPPTPKSEVPGTPIPTPVPPQTPGPVASLPQTGEATSLLGLVGGGLMLGLAYGAYRKKGDVESEDSHA